MSCSSDQPDDAADEQVDAPAAGDGDAITAVVDHIFDPEPPASFGGFRAGRADAGGKQRAVERPAGATAAVDERGAAVARAGRGHVLADQSSVRPSPDSFVTSPNPSQFAQRGAIAVSTDGAVISPSVTHPEPVLRSRKTPPVFDVS